MQLPHPGSISYFPSLLAHIRTHHPDLPLEPVILQSILLCLIARPAFGDIGHTTHDVGNKNLILRTSEEDVGLVLSLASTVLTHVFGLSVHKCRIKEDIKDTNRYDTHTSPDQFLRSLFFRGKRGSRLKSNDRPRYDSLRKSSKAHTHRRSSTVPNSTIADDVSSLSPNAPPAHGHEVSTDSQFEVASMGSSRRLFITPHSTLGIRPPVTQAQSEPSPMLSVFAPLGIDTKPSMTSHPSASSAYSSLNLPKVVVLSGLEFSEVPSQRTLLQVLQERKLVLDSDPEDSAMFGGTWNLPDEFFVVYVCPLDPEGGPSILRSLLDRFAMSVDVSVTPVVRQAHAAHRSSISTPLSASFHSLSPRSPLASPYTSPDTQANYSPQMFGGQLPPTSQSKNPIFTLEDLQYLRSLANPEPIASAPRRAEWNDLPTIHTRTHPTLDLYLADLFAAARHHPLLDGTLLTLRAHRDAEDLARAFRVIEGNSIGADLVKTIAVMSPDGYSMTSSMDEVESKAAQTDDESLSWGKGHEDEKFLGEELEIGRRKASSVDQRSLQVRIQDVEGLLHDGRSTQSSSRAETTPPLEIWDVSEVDIAKVFPRVVSHRLRMRLGPDDEMLGSVMYPAVATPYIGGKQGSKGRSEVEVKSVKQVIVGILADV